MLVDIGRVDLDSLSEIVRAERLSEQHGQRVRLLAGGAARTPNAKRFVGGPFGQQCRNGLVLDEFPCWRVSEERRDVDQDGVEQRGELVSAGLQKIEVVLVALASDLVHPVSHAARQRRALVSGEVETPLIAHVAQQGLERFVCLLVQPMSVRRRYAAKLNILAITVDSPDLSPPTPSCQTASVSFPM